MQRYIKKIGYKQDAKPEMLSWLTEKRTNTKKVTPLKSAKFQVFKCICSDMSLTKQINSHSIYKSLTKSATYSSYPLNNRKRTLKNGVQIINNKQIQMLVSDLYSLNDW